MLTNQPKVAVVGSVEASGDSSLYIPSCMEKFLDAARHGQLAGVVELSKNLNNDIKEMNEALNTWLGHDVCPDVVKWLIRHTAASVNYKQVMTPPTAACANDERARFCVNLYIVKYLVETCHASVDMTDSNSNVSSDAKNNLPECEADEAIHAKVNLPDNDNDKVSHTKVSMPASDSNVANHNRVSTLDNDSDDVASHKKVSMPVTDNNVASDAKNNLPDCEADEANHAKINLPDSDNDKVSHTKVSMPASDNNVANHNKVSTLNNDGEVASHAKINLPDSDNDKVSHTKVSMPAMDSSVANDTKIDLPDCVATVTDQTKINSSSGTNDAANQTKVSTCDSKVSENNAADGPAKAEINSQVASVDGEKVTDWRNGSLHYIIKLLTKYSVDMKVLSEALILSCSEGHLDVVKWLVEHTAADVNHMQGWTPLTAACSKDCLDIVKYLVETRLANVNLTDGFGYTPLTFVCRNHISIPVLTFLLSEVSDLDVNIAASGNNKSETALHMAIWHNKGGVTPLHLACDKNDVSEVLRLVYVSGHEIDAQDNSANTPLHRACFYGGKGTVETLMLAGADERITNDEMLTPAQLAERNKRSELLELLNRDSLQEVILRRNKLKKTYILLLVMLTIRWMKQKLVKRKWYQALIFGHIVMQLKSAIIFYTDHRNDEMYK